ncbi:protein farnesyltransferase/ geranylgeranyltransferase type-1 subunit alpha-like [Argonauta hians]
MADSSSDEGEVTRYDELPEWRDIAPVPQDDGPFPVVRISYTEQFQMVYNYFRAIVAKNERSERALKLTKDAIDMNAANYTVWHYRRLLLKDLDCDLYTELKYVSEVIREHPKNYQVWHHRQVIVEWLDDPNEELTFTASILILDAKNYHAWQHRQWVLKKYSLWNLELRYVDKLLKEDLRNNSAWNQRYFVLNNTTSFDEKVIEQEIEYTTQYIRQAPHNESSWNYVKGLLIPNGLCNYPQLLEFCLELYNTNVTSPHLLACMVDIYESMLEKDPLNREVLTKATQICDSLSQQHDPIRQEYWNYVGNSLKLKFASEDSKDDMKEEEEEEEESSQ